MIRNSKFLLFFIFALVAFGIGTGVYIYAEFSPAVRLTLAVISTFLTILIFSFFLLQNKDATEYTENLSEIDHHKMIFERLAGLEHKIQLLEQHKTPTNNPALANEMALLSEIIGHIAETVSEHEALLVMYEHDHAIQNEKIERLDIETPKIEIKKTEKPSQKGLKHSLEENRFELFLFPIVTLPQRKIVGYESLSRLKLQDGNFANAEIFMPVAEKAGVVHSIESMQIKRSIRMISRLNERGRDTRIYSHLSLATLQDDEFMSWLIAEYENNPLLSKHLVLSLSQKTWKALGVVELESLEALEVAGCRYALKDIFDLKLSYKDLYESGVRFIQLSAEMMLHGTRKAGSEVHVEDLHDFMKRQGIFLIVDQVNMEAEVIELLDLHIMFAQGAVFSQPKPVRIETYEQGA